MNNILEIKKLDVCLKKNNKIILKNINLEIKKGDRVGIAGESGAGKTTLINTIMSFLDLKNFEIVGEIILDNKKYSEMNLKEKKKNSIRNISIIPQDAINSLNPYEKIGKQLLETLLFYDKNIKKNEAIENIKNVLKKLNFKEVEKIYESYPYQLSGGMKQRIVIAFSLLGNKKLLLADEPTTSIDAINQYRFIMNLKKVCEDMDLTLVYISHDIKILSQICEKIIIIKEGEIVEVDNIKNILKYPKSEYTKELINRIID